MKSRKAHAGKMADILYDDKLATACSRYNINQWPNHELCNSQHHSQPSVLNQIQWVEFKIQTITMTKRIKHKRDKEKNT